MRGPLRNHEIMKNIHHRCVEPGDKDRYINYMDGANFVGFVKVADATLAYGTV